MDPRIVICMKWGTRYGPQYVNRLHSMVRRNASGPLRMICYTDDAEGIDSEVEVFRPLGIRLPDGLADSPWRKMALWAPQLAGVTGTVLYVDLDVVITGSIDDFFSYEPGRTCLTHPSTGDLAVMRFEVGSAPHLFAQMEEATGAPRYRTGHGLVSAEGGLPLAFWPSGWCLGFRQSLVPPWPLNLLFRPRLPDGTRLVAFTGPLTPADALLGRWPAPWYQRMFRHVRSSDWIGEYWR